MTDKKAKNESSINLLDVFFYILSYWYLFVIAIVICVGVQMYRYAKAPFVYSSTATVMIKDPSNTRSSTKLDAYSSMINRTNVSNEILQFKSKRLMTEVMNRLGANVSFKENVGLRQVELYKDTPVSVIHSENFDNQYFALTVTPGKDSTFTVRIDETRTRKTGYNDTLRINGGFFFFDYFILSCNYLIY